MSEAIGGAKNNEQCRNHFIKKMIALKTIPNIIEDFYRRKKEEAEV